MKKFFKVLLPILMVVVFLTACYGSGTLADPPVSQKQTSQKLADWTTVEINGEVYYINPTSRTLQSEMDVLSFYEISVDGNIDNAFAAIGAITLADGVPGDEILAGAIMAIYYATRNTTNLLVQQGYLTEADIAELNSLAMFEVNLIIGSHLLLPSVVAEQIFNYSIPQTPQQQPSIYPLPAERRLVDSLLISIPPEIEPLREEIVEIEQSLSIESFPLEDLLTILMPGADVPIETPENLKEIILTVQQLEPPDYTKGFPSLNKAWRLIEEERLRKSKAAEELTTLQNKLKNDNSLSQEADSVLSKTITRLYQEAINLTRLNSLILDIGSWDNQKQLSEEVIHSASEAIFELLFETDVPEEVFQEKIDGLYQKYKLQKFDIMDGP